MMQGADTLLMVGSSFPYSEFLLRLPGPDDRHDLPSLRH